jgi:hypothetical protein
LRASPAALERLVKVALGAEEAYFGNMDWDEKHLYLKGNPAYPGPGEQHVSLPITGVYGTPSYLLEPNLTIAGRKAYSAALEVCLKEAYAVGDQFSAQEKTKRLQTALLNAMMMVRTAISTEQVKHT